VINQPLGPEASATVTLDGSGNGTAKTGPLTARESWAPANVHVSAATHVKEAQCVVYVGDSIRPNTFRDSTLSGSTGDVSDAISSDIVTRGIFIWAVWTGGDAGAQATMNVTGSRQL